MSREILKSNKGFTIMELLSVIAILLIIMVIAMPSITSLLGRTNEKISKEKENAFISAARDYVSDHYNSISSNSCNITLSKLYDEGYLSKNSYNDTDGNPYPGGIKYTYDSGLKDEYEYNSGITDTTC